MAREKEIVEPSTTYMYTVTSTALSGVAMTAYGKCATVAYRFLQKKAYGVAISPDRQIVDPDR